MEWYLTCQVRALDAAGSAAEAGMAMGMRTAITAEGRGPPLLIETATGREAGRGIADDDVCTCLTPHVIH